MSERLAQIRGETQSLFAQADLVDWLATLKRNCQAQILGASEEALLGADVDTWAAQITEAFTVEPVSIRRDEVELEDLGECQVDVRHDQNRAIFDTTQPALIPGRRAVVHIPFSGDEHLLRCRGRQYSLSPPRAAISKGEIKLFFEWPHDHKPAIKKTTDALIETIERQLSWQKSDIEAHNRELPGFARHVIDTRRQRVLADREHLDGLGIPVRRSSTAPKTYVARGIARRPSPLPPQQRVSGSTPLEPTLVGEFYTHILGVVSAMARGMERTPGDYARWNEEQLRDALLVLLNTHYEGQATGETFNKSGKTDILIRVEDRNVFVAECKWWSGPAAFASPDREESSALDQLLGYTTWRDAKLALVMFVDRKDMSRVLSAAREKLAAHPAFEDWQDGADEGELRCRVQLPHDEERHADLTVLFVHLPLV